MNNEEIRVSWQAAVVPVNSSQTFYGKLSKIGNGQAVVKVEKDLRPGHQCNFALMLPRIQPEDPVRVIAGRGVVVTSVLSAMDFHLTLKLDKLKASDEQLLNEHINRVRLQKK